MSDLASLIERKAYSEETLAALFFIAAAIAFHGGMSIFGWLLIAKGLLDTLSAAAAWMRLHRLRAGEQS